MRKRILDQPIDILTINEASYLIRSALISSKQFKIITLNPEMIINAINNIEFQSAINNAHLIVADGTGIVWALKQNGHKNAVRIPGIELAEATLQIANELSKKVAIFGGKSKILDSAVIKLSEKFPKANIVKAINGYQAEKTDEEIAKDIAFCNPDIVFIALGTPKQEIWINKFSSLFPHSVMIGIGGSLDVWSGEKRRAPEWMRENNLEWLFRVINEPSRVPRVLKSLPHFIFMVLISKR